MRLRKDHTTFWNFRNVKTLTQRTQVDNFPTEKFSVPFRMEEITAMVLVKEEFEKREKNQNVFSGNFGLLSF